MANTIMNESVSRIAFLFIAFVIISSGYVTQVLPCQTQLFFENSIIAKHIVGVLISFMFIMLEGGWSFDKKIEDKAQVDWSNGNVMDSLVFGFVLYSVFLLTSKMKLIPNLILYSILFIVYLLNTQRLYWENRKLISEEKSETYLQYIKYMLILCSVVFLYGFIDYYKYQKVSYGKNFSMTRFFLGNSKCKTFPNK